MSIDVLVLGAGIVGICTAVHLQDRGKTVLVVDRAGVGTETSSGNAGLIERSSVIPYAFPRGLSALLSIISGQTPGVRYELGHVLRNSPWLFGYWLNSSPGRLARISRELLPLIEACVHEHDALAARANATHLIRPDGWIEIFRNARAQDSAIAFAQKMRQYRLDFEFLDRAALASQEPILKEAAISGIHWRDPKSVTDPGALVRAYADLFKELGGHCETATVTDLVETAEGWKVRTSAGEIFAKHVVVALGAWSTSVLAPLGYRIPLGIKRGYHMHYALGGGATLRHPILDEEGGYVLSSMERGLRLTTGVELASETPGRPAAQLPQSEAIARTIVPIEARIDAEPWLGRRPCLPDMKPVISAASRHRNLWMNFGHAHHGLTLGPVSGRLMAEMITGEPTLANPEPFSAMRF